MDALTRAPHEWLGVAWATSGRPRPQAHRPYCSTWKLIASCRQRPSDEQYRRSRRPVGPSRHDDSGEGHGQSPRLRCEGSRCRRLRQPRTCRVHLPGTHHGELHRNPRPGHNAVSLDIAHLLIANKDALHATPASLRLEIHGGLEQGPCNHLQALVREAPDDRGRIIWRLGGSRRP